MLIIILSQQQTGYAKKKNKTCGNNKIFRGMLSPGDQKDE
jgi:hypothetical protein